MSYQVSAAPYAYITNQLEHNVSVVDLENGQLVTNIPVGLNPAGVTVCDNGNKVIVSSPEEKAIFVLDAITRTVVNKITVGKGPLGIVCSATGKRVYVADWYTHKVSIIDIQQGKNNY